MILLYGVQYITLVDLQIYYKECTLYYDLILILSSTGQRRTMFIQTQSTPNPVSLMFYPGRPVMETGSADFPNARSAMNASLAKALFGIDGKCNFTT